MVSKPNIIVRLPEELRALVLSFCDSSTVLHLCLVSKGTHQTCLPSLFHTVDLSTHNEVSWRQNSEYININVPADHPRRVLTLRDQSVIRRQRQFIDLLRQHPDVGSQVRVLRWTMMDVPPQVTFTGTVGTYGNPVQRHISPWATFQLCTRVIEIDLAFMNDWNAMNVPSPLFSTATSVSLSGIVGHGVLESIFGSINPSKLRHLRLNNVQTFADPRHILKSLSSTHIDLARRDRPGAMQGYLLSWVGRCPRLRSLHILTTAEFVDQSMNHFGQQSMTWYLEVTDENNRYAEIGRFLDSVKYSLREFIFEHGPDIDYYGNSPGRHTNQAFGGPNHDVALPMDAYFNSHILHVIAAGPWPKLEKIVVRGIGHWKPIDPWKEESTPHEIQYLHRKTRDFRDRAELIWDAVGGYNVDAIIEDEARQPFYRLQTDERRSSTGDVA